MTFFLDRHPVPYYNKMERLYLWIPALFRPDMEGGRAEPFCPTMP